MADPPDDPGWKIDSLEEARQVINILHRRSVREAEYVIALADRVRALEAPLHRRLWRKLRG